MPARRLTDDAAREIHALYAAGFPVGDIARRFGVSKALVYRVCSGRSWRHLNLPPVRRSGGPSPLSGEANGRSKLTREQVLEIRRLHAQGISQAELARRYGVSAASINHVVNGITWSWLPVDGQIAGSLVAQTETQ